MDAMPCPFPIYPNVGSHSYEGVIVEGYVLVLYCRNCGDRIWPKGLSDVTDGKIDTTIKTAVEAA